jgi:hypothetical protein
MLPFFHSVPFPIAKEMFGVTEKWFFNVDAWV